MPLPLHYICPRTAEPVEVNGDIHKSVWQPAPWSEDFVDIEGHLQPKPPFRTRVKMLWDDEHLYIAAELQEPHVWGTLTERDSVIFQDNDFEVFIDPDGDNHHYVELEINALGTVWDLLLPKPYKDNGMPLSGWSIKGLQSAIRVNGTLNDPCDEDEGWCVELALPWKSLTEVTRNPCPPQKGDQWRINFSRVQWDTGIEDGRYRKVPDAPEHNWVWSPQGFIDMHRPHRWGFIQFADSASEAFAPDPDWAAKELLHRVYYAQVAFRKHNGRWASSTAELKMPEGVEIHATPNLFEARVDDWNIRQDSYLWRRD